jgi:hypothetical protein
MARRACRTSTPASPWTPCTHVHTCNVPYRLLTPVLWIHDILV